MKSPATREAAQGGRDDATNVHPGRRITARAPSGRAELLGAFRRRSRLLGHVVDRDDDQLNKFPPTEAAGILKDGDMLVLTGTRRENGVPIRIAIRSCSRATR